MENDFLKNLSQGQVTIQPTHHTAFKHYTLHIIHYTFYITHYTFFKKDWKFPTRFEAPLNPLNQPCIDGAMQSNVIFRKTPLKPTKNLHYISFMHHFPAGLNLTLLDLTWSGNHYSSSSWKYLTTLGRGEGNLYFILS